MDHSYVDSFKFSNSDLCILKHLQQNSAKLDHRTNLERWQKLRECLAKEESLANQNKMKIENVLEHLCKSIRMPIKNDSKIQNVSCVETFCLDLCSSLAFHLFQK